MGATFIEFGRKCVLNENVYCQKSGAAFMAGGEDICEELLLESSSSNRTGKEEEFAGHPGEGLGRCCGDFACCRRDLLHDQ